MYSVVVYLCIWVQLSSIHTVTNYKSFTWVWASYRPQDENIGLYLYSWLPFTILTLPHSLCNLISLQFVKKIIIRKYQSTYAVVFLLAPILVHLLVIHNLCTESSWNKRILLLHLFYLCTISTSPLHCLCITSLTTSLIPRTIPVQYYLGNTSVPLLYPFITSANTSFLPIDY